MRDQRPDPSLDRRVALRLGGLAAVGALAACGSDEGAAPDSLAVPDRVDSDKLTSSSALARLRTGNARFVDGTAAHPDQSTARRKQLATAQYPFAQVLTCADARVPPELVFDQGLGDLFVVRNAGPVLDRAILGSLQHAVMEWKTPLLVVLGHTKCSAVLMTVEAIQNSSPPSGIDSDALVAAIKPAVEEAGKSGSPNLLDASVKAHIGNLVERLQAASALADAVKSRKLRVIGAIYDLATGRVLFG